MKKLFFCVIACAAMPAAFGQLLSNEASQAQSEATRISGDVDYLQPDGQHVNVGYSFAPVAPTSVVQFKIGTPYASPLRLKVRNSEGTEVAAWNPETEQPDYAGSLDLSTLPQGTYKYELYWNESQVTSVNFNKQ